MLHKKRNEMNYLYMRNTHLTKIYDALLLSSSIYIITGTTTYVKAMGTPYLVEMI